MLFCRATVDALSNVSNVMKQRNNEAMNHDRRPTPHNGGLAKLMALKWRFHGGNKSRTAFLQLSCSNYSNSRIPANSSSLNLLTIN
jgi:hypothetical protein